MASRTTSANAISKTCTISSVIHIAYTDIDTCVYMYISFGLGLNIRPSLGVVTLVIELTGPDGVGLGIPVYVLGQLK